MRIKTTLEQWQTLFEIDKAGSIQAAALAMNKSHTTLIYAVKKLEDQLGVAVLEVRGRRAVLTDDGQSLLRRANAMLEQARELEDLSEQLAKGVESEIIVAVDHLCDLSWLYKPMSDYLANNSTTSIQIVETSLSKTNEMVVNEVADIAIINLPVTNYPAEAFGMTTMVPVVVNNHPLAQLESVCLSELSTVSQVVVRDLGNDVEASTKQDVGWLKSQQRVTVDNFEHAFKAVVQGVGYCRLPAHVVDEKGNGRLKVLNVEHSGQYQVPLHLTLPKGAKTGPAALCFYEMLLSSASGRLQV
ncbi:LysR family transcriptional regulator [Vibrio sp. T187]|uniref:LysR family transcriptional regulator n=1 Tax=Vibrio TaxID=662 RepID=UPI0010C9BDB8|nr:MULTISPECIES: LysR family transcriptional regulator [Vibrio]MBW3694493.1 LysR family transcriptional regulator [Vibrio sp. T187]